VVRLPTQEGTFVLAAHPGRGELVTFGIGRYERQVLVDVASSDPQYLDWMLQQVCWVWGSGPKGRT
jgi:hypothetical protein